MVTGVPEVVRELYKVMLRLQSGDGSTRIVPRYFALPFYTCAFGNVRWGRPQMLQWNWVNTRWLCIVRVAQVSSVRLEIENQYHRATSGGSDSLCDLTEPPRTTVSSMHRKSKQRSRVPYSTTCATRRRGLRPNKASRIFSPSLETRTPSSASTPRVPPPRSRTM